MPSWPFLPTVRLDNGFCFLVYQSEDSISSSDRLEFFNGDDLVLDGSVDPQASSFLAHLSFNRWPGREISFLLSLRGHLGLEFLCCENRRWFEPEAFPAVYRTPGFFRHPPVMNFRWFSDGSLRIHSDFPFTFSTAEETCCRLILTITLERISIRFSWFRRWFESKKWDFVYGRLHCHRLSGFPDSWSCLQRPFVLCFLSARIKSFLLSKDFTLASLFTFRRRFRQRERIDS